MGCKCPSESGARHEPAGDRDVQIAAVGDLQQPATCIQPQGTIESVGARLKGGSELALIGSGATVTEILKASEELSEKNPWVVDMHTIKPIDKALIKTLGDFCKTIVTVEDHNIIGGLGTAVAEVLAENRSQARLVRLGILDTYAESGTPKDLYEKYGLAGPQIAKNVASIL